MPLTRIRPGDKSKIETKENGPEPMVRGRFA